MLILGLAGYAALHATATYSDAWRAVLWGVPALLIVAGTLSAAPGMGGRATVLGDASYSIYLLHPLLVGFAWRLLGWLPALGFVLASLLLSGVVGLLCFAWLEKPMTEALKGLLQPHVRRSQAAAT